MMTVLITGASSGIGAALAGLCSNLGAKVALAARREDRLIEVASTCPGPTLIIPSDVTTPRGRSEIVGIVDQLESLANFETPSRQ